MGDVFDAMNRAKAKRAAEPSAPQAPADTPADPQPREETPALPIAQIAEAAQAARDQDDNKSAHTLLTGHSKAPPVHATSTTVSQAAEKSEQDQAQRKARRAAAEAATVVPHHAPGVNGYSDEVVVHHDRGSLITEQYRAIRTQVLARARNRRLQLHVITSAAPEEGKTITSLNLGVAFSEIKNQNTLLIEGDLRRPSFEHYLGKKPKHGLLQFLRGETDDIDDLLAPTVYDNLHFIPAGGCEGQNSTELLSSPRMAQLLDRLRDRFEHIFIDTPPVISVTDACILGAVADQVIMCVRLNKTPSEVIERAKRLLRAANCEVAGVILTHQQPDIGRYLYRYGYGSYYTKSR